MKKGYALAIIISILFTNTLTISANEEAFSPIIEKEEVILNDEQVIKLENRGHLSDIDYQNSVLLLVNEDGEEKSIRGCVETDNIISFAFLIDESYGLGSWQAKHIELVFTDGRESIRIEGTDKFDVINQSNEKDSPINEIVDTTSEESISYTTEVLSNIKAVSENGKIIITGDVSSIVSAVAFPTWTNKNGQDDLTWENGIIKNGQVTYTIDMKNHKNETGTYLTHIYVYNNDNTVLAVFPLTSVMEYAPPKINNVKVVQENGKYNISANVTGYDIKSAQFPTWTNKDGQDDLTWGIGNVSGSTISYTVEAKDHKYEKGLYFTHIYVYDGLGNLSVHEVDANMSMNELKINDIQVTKNNGQFKITADLSGYEISHVQFPTWTSKNGQDDITWGTGIITGNKVSYTVQAKDHKYEEGIYYTHIYLYDKLGNFTVKELTTDMDIDELKIENVEVINGDGQYKVTATVSGYDLTSVQFPTWTNKNGQDDIQWASGTITGNKISYIVQARDHKYEEGIYCTHIYLYDGKGSMTAVPIEVNMSINAPSISNVSVNTSEGRYTITAIASGYDIKSAQFPTWTDNKGQDDLTWGIGTINGNTISYTVDMKDHKYETGLYHTHIYVYDGAGRATVIPVDAVIENSPPVIEDVVVSDVTAQGYLITCTVKDGYGIDRVMFPTWTTRNGQDDVKWNKGTITGNQVSFRLMVRDHNFEFGEYQTHIYAYDKAGMLATIAIPNVNINDTSSVPGWKIVNGHKYLYDANKNLVGNGLLVIDISEHNGDINWTAVKNAGVDGVILRSSYGFNSDLSQMDKKFKKNVTELNRLGIPYGIYHFTYATEISDGAEEARYLLRCLKEAGAKPTLPIYYDLEYSDYVGYKNGTFYAELTKNFAGIIQNAGYQIGVYANYDWWTNKLTDKSFDNYIKWVAHYGTKENNAAGTANPKWHPTSTYKIWQYSSCGKVNGISTNVDMNILY